MSSKSEGLTVWKKKSSNTPFHEIEVVSAGQMKHELTKIGGMHAQLVATQV